MLPGPRLSQAGQKLDSKRAMWHTMGTMGLVWATNWQLILDWVLYINERLRMINQGVPIVAQWVKNPDWCP
uniref:Uncharacterized protein n=1 Tax=Catagonus wagneri TaxID=51154 RepID=A0A8C3YBQ7_9CETA